MSGHSSNVARLTKVDELGEGLRRVELLRQRQQAGRLFVGEGQGRHGSAGPRVTSRGNGRRRTPVSTPAAESVSFPNPDRLDFGRPVCFPPGPVPLALLLEVLLAHAPAVRRGGETARPGALAPIQRRRVVRRSTDTLPLSAPAARRVPGPVRPHVAGGAACAPAASPVCLADRCLRIRPEPPHRPAAGAEVMQEGGCRTAAHRPPRLDDGLEPAPLD